MLDTIDTRRLRAKLRRIHLFSGAGRADLDAISEFSVMSHPEAGQRLFSRHEPCRAVFHVAAGVVKLTRRVARGGEQLLDIAAPGRMLGMTAMCTGAGYPFDAVVMTEAEIVVVQAAKLLAFVESRPARLLRLCAELALCYESMVVRLDHVVGRSAPERVALCLLWASDPVAADGSVCTLFGEVRHADIANLLGVTPETFSRVLARFRREGWVREEHGMPHVLDRDGLASVLGERRARTVPARRAAGAMPALAG